MKDGECITMLDEYESIGPHQIALYVDAENVTFFVLELNRFQKKIRKYIRNKSIATNIRIIQVYDSVMCGYVCIGYTECKSLLDYTNLFYLNRCEKNDKILLKYFQQDLNKLK